MATLDERIAQSLRESLRKGELQSSASWGKPLDLDDGFERTPEALRLAFKALKSAGFVPSEVETMKQIAALRRAIAADPDAPGTDVLRQRASELQQHLALRLEKLRRTGGL
jgi:Domain of unknown function (DUF1992)